MYVIINSDCDTLPEGVQPLVSEGSVLLNFLLCLGYDPADPPLADLLAKSCHLKGDWLILSPVHWQATHNDALIVATGKDLQLHEDEAKLWFDFCAEYFAGADMTLHYYDAQTWLLYDHQQHPLKAKPAHHLVNKSFMPELTQLDSTLFWQKFITESQMLFASQTNESSINGLWPWGGAQLTDQQTITICADEYFLPLAKICSSKVTRYSPSVKIKEQQILLLSDFSVLSEAHQEELKKLSVHWYWNNAAYTRSNWLTRLWRKMIYAH